MTNIQDIAYPRPKIELERSFTLTADEIDLMKANTMAKSLETQVGFMIILKCYQCLGHPTSIKKFLRLLKSIF